MRDNDEPKKSADICPTKALDKLLPGGVLGPITNKDEFEAGVNKLPQEQQELAAESARFADLWQYFGHHRIQLPEDALAEVAELTQLSANDKLQALRHVNKTLMEYLNDLGEDSGIRQ